MMRIIHGNKVYALVLSGDDFQGGTRFISEADWLLQVGLMTLPVGHTIAAHAHLPRHSPGSQPTQEFLMVVAGQMEVDFFDEAGEFFHTDTLRQGQALFHIRGGHAFRFLEPTRLIEVKSGPYFGRERDKVLLDLQSAAPDESSTKRLDIARSGDLPKT